MRTQFSKIALTATLGFAITFTLSCSGGDDFGNEPSSGSGAAVSSSSGGSDGGVSEGLITYGIKDIGESSFTAVEKEYNCQENGTLEERTYECPTSYTINGSTLSFGGAEFSGNSASLIGTWNSSSLQHIQFRDCISISGVSKAVFTQNSLSITTCFGEVGEKERRDRNGNVIKIDGVAIIEKVIDCGTAEYTKGTEMVRLKISGTTEEVTATYKDKTCKLEIKYSESQRRAACTQAYNKAKAEGYDGSEYNYYEILYKEVRNCGESLPEWVFLGYREHPTPPPYEPPPLGIEDYDIADYKTVVIGSQTWMAENLNYNASGSKCYGNDPANCDKYGRLYSWATAMALDEFCNSNSCASQIKAKHRGICPTGWHLPSDAEWQTLIDYVETQTCTDCAGIYLRSASDWDDYDYDYDNGTDAYGFSALPGGYGYSGGGFYNVGHGGVWWSSSEIDAYRASYRDRDIYHDYETVHSIDAHKSYLFSVRCIKD